MGWTSESPWSNVDNFNPPTPNVSAPKPRTKVPKLVPDEDRLFQLQRNAIKAVNGVAELKRLLRDDDNRHVRTQLNHLELDVENVYRVIRSYLEEHSSQDASF